MLRAGEAVSHNGGEQRIDAAEHAQHCGIHEHQTQLAARKGGHMQAGELSIERRNGLETGVVEQGHRQHRSQHKRQELRRAESLHAGWGEPEDRNGDQRQRQLHRLNSGNQTRQVGQGSHHPARCGLPQESGQLENHQDGSNPRHEAGDHGVWHLGDVSTQTEHAKKDLKQTRQDDHGEGHGHGRFLVRSCGGEAQDHRREHHGHGTGGFGDQGGRSAEERRHQADDHGAPKPRGRVTRCGDPEGQGHRQSNHRGGHATKGVTPEVAGADPVQQGFLSITQVSDLRLIRFKAESPYS